MSTTTPSFSRDEARHLLIYLGAIDYELGLIAGEKPTNEESASLDAIGKRTRGLISAVEGAGGGARGRITIDRAKLSTLVGDLEWLADEWSAGLRHMDAIDAADYGPRISTLRHFIDVLAAK